MAENQEDQTQYANPETGEVPIAPKAEAPAQSQGAPVTWGTPEMYNKPAAPPDIVRENPYQPGVENPYGGPNVVPPPPPPPPPPNPTLMGAMTAPPNAPMPTSIFNTKQVDALEAKKIITTQEAENLRQHSANQAAIYGGASQEDRAAAAQSKLDLIAAQKAADKRDEEIRAMVREQYNKNIDPQRWWNNKSTGEKVLGGIGMILGGLGAGLQRRGGANPAMQVMNQAISNDIDAQKSEIAKNYEAISKMHGLNESTFNRELHKQVWENNYRTAALERVKLDLAKNAALTTSETVKNNAQEAIINLTEEQNKIRNNQYVLAQNQLAAERTRIRELEKAADGDIQKLMEKDGVDFDTASRAVFERPRFRELVQMGRGSPESAAKQRLTADFQGELAKQMSLAKTLGLKPGDPKYEQIVDVVRKDPKYAPITQPQSVGVVVPKTQPGGEERQKQINDRTVNVLIYDKNGNPIGSEPKLAVNKNAADAFAAYQDASPQFKAEYEKLKAAAKSGNVAQYEQSRAVLIDLFPKFKFGSHNAPTESQKATAEEIIPTYTHWYNLGLQSRRDEKIKGMADMIADREKTIHQETFGSSSTTPPAPGHAPSGSTAPTSTVPPKFDFKPGSKK